MFVQLKLDKKNIYIAILIFIISSLYYMFHPKRNIIIDKLNEIIEKQILSQSDRTVPVQHISSYQKINKNLQKFTKFLNFLFGSSFAECIQLKYYLKTKNSNDLIKNLH